MLLLAATLAAGLALAACGSSSNTNSASASSGGSAASAAGGTTRAKFVACLKSHGVTLPAGAGAGAGRFRRFGGTGASGPRGGGGFLFGGGRRPAGATGGFGARFGNPRTLAALRACGAGNFTGRFNPANLAKFRAQRDATIKSFVTCVGKHGDKITANLSGTGPVLSSTLRTNKKFLAAAKPCESILNNLRGGFGGAPGGGGFGGAPAGGLPPGSLPPGGAPPGSTTPSPA